MSEPCKHPQVIRWSDDEDEHHLWACVDCRLRFSPGRHTLDLDSPAWKRIEERFWREEAEWAKAGSGMTKEQRTGATMLLVWLQDPSGGGLRTAQSAHTLDLDSPATVERLARALHEASGTHSMTPMRMLCAKPLSDAHRLMAERIVAALREETLGS